MSMGKKISAIDSKMNWILPVIDYLIKKNPNSVGLPQFRSITIDAYKRKSIEGLNHLYRDIGEMVRGLPVDQQNELDQLLKQAQVHGINPLTTEISAGIKIVLGRGNISNEHEYRMVADYVDDLSINDPSNAYIQSLNDYLRSYNSGNSVRNY